VPTIVAFRRVEALNSLLQELSSECHDWLEECNRQEVGSEPIEHIFSHVRHTMWIEHGDGSQHVDKLGPVEWTSSEGKELRWMSEADMQQVGVTAGVKKILKAVKQSKHKARK
jgi:A/G-specific adenine glycosylase